VRVDTPAGSVEGAAVDITTDGSLLVQPEGTAANPVVVVAGDVTHLTYS